MSRCVVNVSTGDRYRRGQARLRGDVATLGCGADFSEWTDPLPLGWPTQHENPYAFKSYAMLEAAKKYRLLLWCDAAIRIVKPLEPLWDRLLREGYWFVLNSPWTNYQWTADSAYPYLFPDMPIEKARELNKTIPHTAGVFGIDARSKIGFEILTDYYSLANSGAFRGPWSNLDCPSHHVYSDLPMASCGPPDVLGHRHDQTALSVIAWKRNLVLTKCPEVFSYPPWGEESLLIADGAYV